MNMKNVNFLQKHVEKLILGAALVVALLIVLVYALGSPYTATVANQEMGPRQVEAYLIEQARDLDRKVSSDQPQFEPPEIAGYSDELDSRLALAPAPMPRYPQLAGRPGVSPTDIGIGDRPLPYEIPRPPLPSDIAARAGYAVLGAFETPEQHQQFAQLVSEKQPWDVRYVSVAAEWPLAEWRNRLENSELPVSFWRSMIGLTGVYLQREELDPESGQWVNTTIVRPLPTQLAALPSQTVEYTDETAVEAVQFLRERQANIARPDFPPLAHGVWLPPGSDFFNLNREQQNRLRDLRRDIGNLERRIQQIQDRQRREAELEARRAGRPPRGQRPQPTRQTNPRGGNFDEMADPGMLPGGRQRVMPQVNPGSEEAEQLTRLLQELQAKRAEQNELVGVPQDTLTDATQMMDPYGAGMYDEFGEDPAMMGMDPYGAPYDPGAVGPGVRRPVNPFARPQPGQPAMPRPGQAPGQAAVNDDTIRVWAHDLTVEPGKTYRYRVLVSVLSPLFRQTRVADEQRSEFFNQVALGPGEQELATSPWSEPVEVDPEYFFFFLSGTAAGQVATVEVWHLYNGMWHKATFQESPGNPIGGRTTIQVDGVEQTLDMQTGAVMVDLVSGGGGGLGADVRLLYFDPNATQAISSRSSRQDQDDDDRIRLENMRSLQEQFATSASAQ